MPFFFFFCCWLFKEVRINSCLVSPSSSCYLHTKVSFELLFSFLVYNVLSVPVIVVRLCQCLSLKIPNLSSL